MRAKTAQPHARSEHGAIAKPGSLPFRAEELCRERMGAHLACQWQEHAEDATMAVDLGAAMYRPVPWDTSRAPAPASHVIQSWALRTRAGQNRCDSRRPLQQTKEAFPGIDFSGVPTEEDVLWARISGQRNPSGLYLDGETEEATTQRGLQFLKWLMER